MERGETGGEEQTSFESELRKGKTHRRKGRENQAIDRISTRNNKMKKRGVEYAQEGRKNQTRQYRRR